MRKTGKVLAFAVILTAIAASALCAVAIPTTGVTELTVGKWTDGNIPAAKGEQWFKFTTAASQTSLYIHFIQGPLLSAKIQMFTSDGTASGAETTFNNLTVSSQRTGLTANTVYYIRATQNTGAGKYRIGVVNATSSSTTPSITLPTAGITPLTAANTWVNGNITAGGEQWFKFTSTGTMQYIHFKAGTRDGVNVQLYDADGTPAGARSSLGGVNLSASRTGLKNGAEYYIMVFHNDGGTYQIGFGSSSTQPAITLPTGTIPELTADTWADGSLTAGKEQWFKIKATAATQYIHFMAGALTGVYVQLFNTGGTAVGTTASYLWPNTPNASRSVTNGSDYYLRVVPASGNSGSGAYKIGFNASSLSPVVVAPSSMNPTDLTVDTWKDGNLTASGEQWFKFTSTGTTQYIFFQKGAVTDIYTQLYTSDGRIIGTRESLSSGYNNASITGLTGNTVYYIKVIPYFGTRIGSYKMGFSASSTAPTK